MNTARTIKEITQYGLSSEELQTEYGISRSTITNYSKHSKGPSKRKSSQSKVLELVHFALKIISSYQGVNPAKELRELTLENHMRVSEFLKKFEGNDLELLKISIKSLVDSKLKEREIERPLDKFEKKYQFVNQETLEVASEESPELVQGIVLDEKINNLARAHALYALSFGAREDYFSFIAGFLEHQSPFMRESAAMGLFQYFLSDDNNHPEVKDILTKKLNSERAEGVKRKIKKLVERMNR